MRDVCRALWRRALPAHFLLHAHATSREVGLAGEALVARRLMARGARVLVKRHRTGIAEIDLLLERGPELWLVEVKTGHLARIRRPDGPPRWDPRGLPGKRLSRDQRTRLTAAARRILAASPRHQRARVMLVEVLVDRRAGALECRVHEQR